MPDPEEAQFTCVGCGASNPVGSETCSGCGHRFSGPDLAPEVPKTPIPSPDPNPYTAPSAPIAPARNFRIGTALMLIAVIAVCLGALRENVALGLVACLSLVPASIRTPLVAGRRRSEGAPMDWSEQLASFSATMLCSWLVAISSSIAFVATCFPVGMATNPGGGLIVGLPVGIGCAGYLTHLFVKIGRSRAARKDEIRYY